MSKHVYQIIMYGPNKDDPKYIMEVIQILEEMEGEHPVLMDHFNFIMNLDLDKDGGKQTNQHKE